MHETLKDWENGVQTRPDCMLRPTCDRVKTAYYRPTTARTRGYRLRDQLHLAARQQEMHCLDLYLLGASLLVTPVSLVTSCKKWTCPPDNHARTFDMSGEILTCLGHTDWHYFEPCTMTHCVQCRKKIMQMLVEEPVKQSIEYLKRRTTEKQRHNISCCFGK